MEVKTDTYHNEPWQTCRR